MIHKKNNIEIKNKIESANYSDSFNQFIFQEILPKSQCLDIGCNTGNLGKSLIEKKKCQVDGLDCNLEVLKIAKKAGYNKIFLVNFNNDNFNLKNLDKKYQTIIFADVLEHLINPTKILSALKNYLTPDGQIIISLPNVAFILNRIHLMFGHWNYRDYGILDKTHLKFYTIKSGINMVESAGLKVIKLKPYNQFGILRFIKPLEVIFPSLFSYQFLIIAKPK